MGVNRRIGDPIRRDGKLEYVAEAAVEKSGLVSEILATTGKLVEKRKEDEEWGARRAVRISEWPHRHYLLYSGLSGAVRLPFGATKPGFTRLLYA